MSFLIVEKSGCDLVKTKTACRPGRLMPFCSASSKTALVWRASRWRHTESATNFFGTTTANCQCSAGRKWTRNRSVRSTLPVRKIWRNKRSPVNLVPLGSINKTYPDIQIRSPAALGPWRAVGAKPPVLFGSPCGRGNRKPVFGNESNGNGGCVEA